MDSRVTVREGKVPILLIAPHGANDISTGEMVEYMADKIDAYAVINWGWRKADQVNCFEDRADCNNIMHCHEDVVMDEFLNPILRYKSRIERSHKHVHQFLFHGMGDDIRKKTGNSGLDLLVGTGASDSSLTHSCPCWYRDALIYLLSEAGMVTYCAGSRSNFAGKAKKNLNQLWKQWYPGGNVYSAQIEIVLAARRTIEDALIYAEYIADVLNTMQKVTKENATHILPSDFFFKTY